MGLTSKTITIASAVMGLAVFSQAPEFAQQYHQRIGGAVDELKTVVLDFDADAANSQLSRDEALNKLNVSKEQFAQDRGVSMTQAIGRFDRLNRQKGWLENSHPLTRPLLVLKNPDSQLLNNAWEIFKPAVPLTSSGALYGAFGAFLAMLLARFGIGGARKIGASGKNKKTQSEPLIEAAPGTVLAANDDTFNSQAQARRLDLSVNRSKGIPGTMQVAPVPNQSAPYLKADSEDYTKSRVGNQVVEDELNLDSENLNTIFDTSRDNNKFKK